MKIDLPAISVQQQIIYKESIKTAINQLKENLAAPVFPSQSFVDENLYARTHLLRKEEGWQAPHPDLITAYFNHFQYCFPQYDTDRKLADLLGLSSNRRVRAYKSGDEKIPYGVWRKFLLMTGRVPQEEIIKVFGFMG